MDEIKVNLGAGMWRHPGWITSNIDSYDHEKIYEISHDLNKKEKLPFDNDTVSLVYCCQVFEHLSNDVVEFTCKDVYRCLKPGGGFRILVPDVVKAYNEYVNRDFWGEWSLAYHRQKQYPYLRDPKYLLEVFYARPGVDTREFKKNLKTMDMKELFDHYTLGKKQDDNPHPHINWFDEEKFNQILSDIGFTDIKRRNPMESEFEEWRMPEFDGFKNRDETSLIMEAIK